MAKIKAIGNLPEGADALLSKIFTKGAQNKKEEGGKRSSSSFEYWYIQQDDQKTIKLVLHIGDKYFLINKNEENVTYKQIEPLPLHREAN